MNIFKCAVGFVVSLLLMLAGVGFSVGPSASNNTVEINSSLAKVWDIMTDVHHQDWRSDLSMYEVIDATAGKQEWLEDYVGGSLLTKSTTTIWHPHQQWETEFESAPFKGSWNTSFEQIKEGVVKVTLVETALVKNVVLRGIATVLFLSEGDFSVVPIYLADLKKTVEKTVQ